MVIKPFRSLKKVLKLTSGFLLIPCYSLPKRKENTIPVLLIIYVFRRVCKRDRLLAADVIARDVQLANWNKESRGQSSREITAKENPGGNTCT